MNIFSNNINALPALRDIQVIIKKFAIFSPNLFSHQVSGSWRLWRGFSSWVNFDRRGRSEGNRYLFFSISSHRHANATTKNSAPLLLRWQLTLVIQWRTLSTIHMNKVFLKNKKNKELKNMIFRQRCTVYYVVNNPGPPFSYRTEVCSKFAAESSNVLAKRGSHLKDSIGICIHRKCLSKARKL